uniref:Serine/threonine-protein phosphatase PGAM5, mitochondrial n=1 Tax=Plectus sambesii TaxID=2011161 RepID=A0A914USM0_9BILA
MRSLGRLGRVALPTGMAAATAWYFSDETRRQQKFTMVKEVFAANKASRMKSATDSLETNPSFYHAFPITAKWDENWDSRDPVSLIDQVAYDEADGPKREEMITKVKSKATRHLILVRHGQYHMDGDKCLTKLGREQAQLLGKRLAIWTVEWDKLIMSTMTRATETANLALEELPKELKRKSDSMLEEGAPYPPEPPVAHWRPQHKEFLTDGARIEAAFRKYVHRASPTQEKDSYELIVCHANVIRYFVCRYVQYYSGIRL